VRDLLYLNRGTDRNGRPRFREVGKLAGVDRRAQHGLGAVMTDLDGDGRLDVYVANDEDPNRSTERALAGRRRRGSDGPRLPPRTWPGAPASRTPTRMGSPRDYDGTA